MFTKFKTNYKTIFLDINSSNVLVDEKVNIIISPSLYWVKKIKLPVKYAREAKKLLPSIFEDVLPDGNYSYDAYKSGEEFFVFAYEDKYILDTITQKGISSSNIANVYFAQSELDKIDGAVNISEEHSLYIKDGLVVLVPCCWIKEKENLNVDNIKLSKQSITLQQYSHIVDKSSLYKILTILFVLLIVLFSEYMVSAKKVQNVLDARDALFSQYKLKPTMIQNRSLLKKFEKIHNKQTKIREIMAAVLSVRLLSTQKLLKIDFRNKFMSIEFSGFNSANKTSVEKALKSKKIKYRTVFKNKIMNVEIKL